MLEKSEAIVLHSLKYGETKIIVDMFTRRWGRLSFIIPLPKSSKGRLKKQYFQPLTLLEIETELRPRLTLQKLQDARMLVPLGSIPLSPAKLAITLFVAEFLYHALRSQQQDEPLFAYIADSIQWLDAATAGFANFHLTFLMRLSRFLGFQPNLEERGERREERELFIGERDIFFDLREGVFCEQVPTHSDYLRPEEARMIHVLMRMDFPTMHLFRFSRKDRQRILDVLLHYYQLHLPDFPEMKSLSVLKELF